MSDYKREIETEAIDFLIEHEEMIVKALTDNADWDYNDIENLDGAWHENIVDRAYTLQDATYILENCEEEETDSGLWEHQDARDAMSTRAAYSFSNDVWFETKKLYDEMKERVEEIKDKLRDDGTEYEKAAQKAFNEFKEDQEKELAPVEKDSPEELSLIGEWLRRNREDAGMRGGYPVGSSYIDSRCGTGHGMPDVKDYVEFDHEFAQRVPWLSGKRTENVQARYDDLMEKKRLAGAPNYSYLDKSGRRKGALSHEIVDTIMKDERLTLANIREIINTLQCRV